MLNSKASVPDALIIGAGVIGMLSALRLHQAGLRVEVLDQASLPGKEASWAGGGIISPLFPWRYADAVNRLAAYGQKVYPELAQELATNTGIDPEYTRNGLLMLPGEEQALGEEAEDWARRWQLESQALDRATLAALAPAIRGAERALWWPSIGQIRNPRLVKALAERLRRLQIPVRTGVRVDGIEQTGGQVRGVLSSSGRLAAGKVIVTAGAWTGRLMEGFGYSLPVEPVRGQMILFRAQPGWLRQMVLSDSHYLVPRRDGRILAGSTLEWVGFDKSPTAQAASLLREKALALAPGLEDFPVEHHWAGLRPGAPEGVPFIGEAPDCRGLYVCAGQFRNGIVMAPGSVALLADLVLQQTPWLDPLPYALNRTPVPASEAV
ncbi:glycine oxidase ThiO [Thermithiobacillus plumbiphilus]|uniref:Glycine oxidase ThiO n=1 Tax=Thermithiobacillus plumbiphilus TaxID=1729899 RepID=A0ABU9D914_9PROT